MATRKYVYVQGGKVVSTRPDALPTSWKDVTGLKYLSDEELLKLGWYPVIFQCDPDSAVLRYVVRKDLVLAYEGLNELKEQLLNELSADLDAALVEPLVSGARGTVKPYTYGVTYQHMIDVFTGYVNPTGGFLLATKEGSGISELEHHTRDQIAALLIDIGAARNLAISTFQVRSNAVKQAVTEEEAQDGATLPTPPTQEPEIVI